jgi:hypothetical protein
VSDGEWVVAGGGKPEVGKEYEVRHSRKGTFRIVVREIRGEWIDGTVVDGVAKAVMTYNVAHEGDSITIRDTMSYLIPVSKEPT